ncbi:MAG: nucleoside kinase [Firmicutes bacterium]|nr:nucleoside kinase [Bacillota bacterium]
MLDMIEVRIDSKYTSLYKKGAKLIDIAGDFQNSYKYDILGAIINNDLKELDMSLENNTQLEFIDITSAYGNRFYSRSLAFLLIIAAKEVMKGSRITIEHSLSKGLYCEIHSEQPLDEYLVQDIEDKMREIVEEDIPFTKRRYPKTEAAEIFEERNQYDKIGLLKYRQKDYINVYSCMGYYDYFYGYLVPSTGYLKKFELKYYPPGLILRFPERRNPDIIPNFVPQPQIFNVFREFEEWGRILEIENIGHLNDYISNGKIKELVWITEALHEKKIAEIADRISHSKDRKKLVLISGPSSSGKTTFAQRLSIQLRVNGMKTAAISIDDFFKDRKDTPKTPEGEYDFETLDAIDTDTFGKVLNGLLDGKEVEIPHYNFHTGKREWKDNRLKLSDEHIIIVEGIHGLNYLLTKDIKSKTKYKIYVSALTHLNIDNHNRVPTSDLRLIRRIVRDYKFRSADALATIRMWDMVRRGEDKYIYPFQEQADIVFNSSLAYELCVLKPIAVSLLKNINGDVIEYIEAKRLLKFFNYLLPFDCKCVPNNSILREYIGDSCFDV